MGMDFLTISGQLISALTLSWLSWVLFVRVQDKLFLDLSDPTFPMVCTHHTLHLAIIFSLMIHLLVLKLVFSKFYVQKDFSKLRRHPSPVLVGALYYLCRYG